MLVVAGGDERDHAGVLNTIGIGMDARMQVRRNAQSQRPDKSRGNERRDKSVAAIRGTRNCAHCDATFHLTWELRKGILLGHLPQAPQQITNATNPLTMLRSIILLLALSLAATWAQTYSPTPAAESDLELKDLDLSNWDCRDKPEGAAKTPDGKERNPQKNRSPVDLTGKDIPSLDIAGFLARVADYDTKIGAKRRRDLTPEQKEQLASFEKELVSVTGWLVMAYPSWPPETANCKSTQIRDWHLELTAEPADHSPQVGDPTALVAEITPRTERSIYRSGIRIQDLAGFIRLPDNKSKATTGGKAHKVRVTGYLLWDDEHNGSYDIGTKVERFTPNGYHNPWRLTAWEVHPVLKIEDLGTK